MEWIAAYENFDDNNLGPHILGVKSRAFTSRLYRLACVVGARGTVSDLRDFVWTIKMASRGFAQGTVSDIQDRDIVIRNGYCDGLTSDELYTLCVGSREGLVRLNAELQRVAWELRDSSQSKGIYRSGSRAMRAKHPGMSFSPVPQRGVKLIRLRILTAGFSSACL